MSDILQRFPHAREVFGELSETELSLFAHRTLRAGEYLTKRDEDNQGKFFYVLSGVLVGEDQKGLTDGGLPVQFVRGDFIGFSEQLYTPALPSTFSTRCKTSVQVLEIAREQMDMLVRVHPRLPFGIFRSVLNKAQNARSVLAKCTSSKTNIAVAYYLAHLYDTYLTLQSEGFSGPIRIIDTHKELCGTLGCSKRTVDRYIAEFAESGMIMLKRGKIHIDAEQRKKLQSYIG